MKYIIAVHAPQNHGKTSMIRNFWDLLPVTHSSVKTAIHLPHSPRTSPEILGYYSGLITKPGVSQPIIGVNSRGDDPIVIVGGILTTYLYDSDIIVCACRNERMLINAINSMAYYASLLRPGWQSVVRAANGGTMPTYPQINDIQCDILSNNWEIILYSHFCDIPDKKVYMGGRLSLPGGTILPRVLAGTSLDLSILSAENVLDLIKKIL